MADEVSPTRDRDQDPWLDNPEPSQAGHDHAGTTSIYTCVSSDYRTRTLRRALDATIDAALKPARGSLMRRRVRYRRRLREVTAAVGMFATSDLDPLPAERGIRLPRSQVHRLVTSTPERLSLPVLAALCDIFECTPAELIATAADIAVVRRTATDDVVVNPAAIRPKRAAIRHLVRQASAPVIARMLGYHHDTTARLATESGGTWKRYAPGDHTP
jgi:DNA-binding Xre family transcriptional regulator